jgi:hypothetical protein
MENQPEQTVPLQASVDLVSLSVKGKPLYIMVNGDEADTQDRRRYYEEDTCPAKILTNTMMLGYEGETDPHGILKYHGSLPKGELLDKFRGGFLGLVDFNELNVYSAFEGMLNTAETQPRETNPKALIKQHLPNLLTALQIYMGITIEVIPKKDDRGEVQGYDLVFHENNKETVLSHQIPVLIPPLETLIEPFV